MFMRENYRWNGHKWKEHKETNPEAFIFESLMKGESHHQVYKTNNILKNKGENLFWL